MTNEIEAVIDRYSRRRKGVDAATYSFLTAATWCTVRERQSAIISGLSKLAISDLSSLCVAEVGAGTGGNLLELLRIGFDPDRLTAIELLPDRVVQARRMLPGSVRVIQGDASVAPIEAKSLDIVYQSVVFSSLLDKEFQSRLANAMWSWLKPGGYVLWYDFTFDNPANPDVRGVPRRRIAELFPEGRISSRRVTLAPPIARRVCRVHPSFYTLFNALPLLRTHLLCWIQKP